jgi:hypothetical protein
LLRDRLAYAGHHNIRARMPHSFIGLTKQH